MYAKVKRKRKTFFCFDTGGRRIQTEVQAHSTSVYGSSRLGGGAATGLA